MVKLLLCLGCAMVIGITTLMLRQQQLELRHQATQYQQQIEAQQARLWGQQLQIALATSPASLKNTVEQHELALAPEPTLPAKAGNWIEQVRRAPKK